MKVIAFTATTLLLLALTPLPIGYYTFLRIAITIAAITFIVNERRNNAIAWMAAFGMVAILFNPIIPIYLYKKALWMLIDIGVAFLFFVYGLKSNKSTPI
jgi:membrane-bound ClpP family serine protease